MLPDENNQSEETQDLVEDVEKAVEEVAQSEEQKEDRPEKNWKAEIERKNKEIERLRLENEAVKSSSVQKRDPADISTWSDVELKAIMHSNDPNTLSYKSQAEDVLFERRVKSIRAREKAEEKRGMTEIELRTKYPEAMDPYSEFALKMEQVMQDFDLHKSSAGRLAAAKLVAAEMQKGSATNSANGRKKEEDRLRDVKANMVDGDRPRSTANEAPKKAAELEKRLAQGDPKAVGEALKQRGISPESFFKR